MEEVSKTIKPGAKTVVTVDSGDVLLEITIAAYRKDVPADKPLVTLK